MEGQQNAELETRSRDPGWHQKAHLKPPAWPKGQANNPSDQSAHAASLYPPPILEL